ncbi:hypothetical protein [Actinoplanes sp. URMC 104]|uniref:hypothetical protein n=1 Tax=Actinoplanes sp. URMC 104 TaxID=3423409 RepID=UPI003F1CC201
MTDDLPRPGAVSNAAFLHDMFLRMRAALDANDRPELARLMQHVRSEGGERLAQLVDSAFDNVAIATAVDALQVPGGVTVPAGLNKPGAALCDFCTSFDVVAFYPFEQFEIPGPTAALGFTSGDKMYVCQRCHDFVEAGDWAGLRRWVGPSSQQSAVLWNGFRMNRTGPAVPYAGE